MRVFLRDLVQKDAVGSSIQPPLFVGQGHLLASEPYELCIAV
jgi:hypothetical protein